MQNPPIWGFAQNPATGVRAPPSNLGPSNLGGAQNPGGNFWGAPTIHRRAALQEPGVLDFLKRDFLACPRKKVSQSTCVCVCMCVCVYVFYLLSIFFFHMYVYISHMHTKLGGSCSEGDWAVGSGSGFWPAGSLAAGEEHDGTTTSTRAEGRGVRIEAGGATTRRHDDEHSC